jgi:hypothetical protein
MWMYLAVLNAAFDKSTPPAAFGQLAAGGASSSLPGRADFFPSSHALWPA